MLWPEQIHTHLLLVLLVREMWLSTKTRIYQTLVVSVLLYASETWTLLAADVKTLEAFHMKCQRQILRIRWQDHVRNDKVAAHIQACAQWWRASGDDVKPPLSTWRECHPTFQLTKHWDYRSRHQSVDDLTTIGSAALVVLATAGSTNSVRTISAHLLTYGEQPSGVVILERRYGPQRLCADNDDDEMLKSQLEWLW